MSSRVAWSVQWWSRLKAASRVAWRRAMVRLVVLNPLHPLPRQWPHEDGWRRPQSLAWIGWQVKTLSRRREPVAGVQRHKGQHGTNFQISKFWNESYAFGDFCFSILCFPFFFVSFLCGCGIPTSSDRPHHFWSNEMFSGHFRLPSSLLKKRINSTLESSTNINVFTKNSGSMVLV